MKNKKILVTIGAEKIEECVKFYEKLLGTSPKVHQVSLYAEFDLEGFILGIFKPRSGEEKEFLHLGRNGGLSICLEVESLELAILHLTELGYPPNSPIKLGSTLGELYIYDPADNRIILYQYL